MPIPKPQSDELYHYGIKGMKWGVRRSEQELRRARGNPSAVERGRKAVANAREGRLSRAEARAAKKVETAQRKATIKSMKAEARRIQEEARKGPKGAQTTSTKRMSDDELRTIVNRINLEKQYSQLTQRQVSEGRRAVNQMFMRASTTVGTKLLIGAGSVAIAYGLHKAGAKVSNADVAKLLGDVANRVTKIDVNKD